MKQYFELGHRRIGPGKPVCIIAEISANHQQDFAEAAAIIAAAKVSGADAVKLQTYTPDTITIRSDRDWFKVKGGTIWDGRTLYDLYKEAYTPWEWHPRLKEVAEKNGLIFFSTAFDPTSVDFLEDLGVLVHKIASFELVDTPLIERVARTGKPLILSTGMATFDEITEAVSCARQGGATQIALLKCTSAYPAPAEEMHLRTIPHMAQAFDCVVGLSDHTLGIAAAVASVALGACLIEKHFILSRSKGGPDAAFSLEPAEFKTMVDAVREAEKALGSVQYGVEAEGSKSHRFRRSLFVVEDVKRGELFTHHNVRSIRPSDGLPPKYERDVLGRRAACDIPKGEPLRWEMILR